MPMLEDGFALLYWPKLMKGIRRISSFPGFEPVFFKNYKELNEYFLEEYGPDWRTTPWAEYWFNQHMETVNSDKRENAFTGQSTYRRKGDSDAVYEIAKHVLDQSPYLSCRKLTYVLNSKGVTVKKSTAANIIKKYKQESEKSNVS